MDNREIKFRVWDNLGRRMLEPFHLFGATMCFGLVEQWLAEIPSDKHSLMRLNDISVMQFTNLKDKNGTDIYEGDLMQYREGEAPKEVVFMNGSFGVINVGKEGKSFGSYRIDDGVVARNIFEHPHN